eukprot:TRINITY_DN2063_c0_g2_i1.p1 TRINITY_DN2063_c0_g2~~TRINITY_DN2063_c0_g2_i1.p1  ORF type:complete len:356 (-),score=90.84 TRINITY_DN2063_c0_g2_i1:615-1682(-)
MSVSAMLTKKFLREIDKGQTMIDASGTLQVQYDLRGEFYEASFDAMGIGQLCKAIVDAKTVRKLDLSRTLIDEKGAEYIGVMEWNRCGLECLDLSWNNMNWASVELVVKPLSNEDSDLKDLRLSGNEFWVDEAAEGFLEFVSVTPLETLFLKEMMMPMEMVEVIGNGLKVNQCLRKLSLADCQLDADAAIVVANALESNETLTELDISKNEFRDKGGVAIAKMLKVNKSLKTLILRMCGISDETAMALVDALETNESLEWIGMQGNRFSDDALELLDGSIDLRLWTMMNARVKREWSVQRHFEYPLQFRERVFVMLLMWNHDQYEEEECDGIRWNELPLEVVMRVVKWLGLFERE